MNKKIENRVYYQSYKKLWKDIEGIMQDGRPEELLMLVHEFVDNMNGYRFEWLSDSAVESIHYLLGQIKTGEV